MGVFECKWGIVTAGNISTKFVKNLLDPSTSPEKRGSPGIKHSVAAVASRSIGSSEAFIGTVVKPLIGEGDLPKAYGSYDELFEDPEVTVAYIGSPHSFHFAHVHAALTAGKHVLVEKPFTVNAQQAQKLVDLAQDKKVFLMEAYWTRFFPLAKKLQELILSGKLGEVKRVFSDLSFDMTPETAPIKRMVDPMLAGGALMDLGPYSLLWPMLAIFPHDASTSAVLTVPKSVKASSKFSNTKVDLSTTAIIEFDNATAIISASQNVENPLDNSSRKGHGGGAVRIQGTEGEIVLEGHAACPVAFLYRSYKNGHEERFDFGTPDGIGNGMFWEADEVANCIHHGLLESPRMALHDTVYIMKLLDTIRAEAGLVFPDEIEKAE